MDGGRAVAELGGDPARHVDQELLLLRVALATAMITAVRLLAAPAQLELEHFAQAIFLDAVADELLEDQRGVLEQSADQRQERAQKERAASVALPRQPRFHPVGRRNRGNRGVSAEMERFFPVVAKKVGEMARKIGGNAVNEGVQPGRIDVPPNEFVL